MKSVEPSDIYTDKAIWPMFENELPRLNPDTPSIRRGSAVSSTKAGKSYLTLLELVNEMTM